MYNRRDKITYCNGAAVHWLGLQTGDDMEPLRRILREKGANADCADSQTPVFTLEDNGERRRLEVRQYIHRDKKGDMVAGTIMLTDVGRYYQLLEQGRELAVTNQSLAIEKRAQPHCPGGARYRRTYADHDKFAAQAHTDWI